MNYKKLKPKNKLKYAHTHMATAREWLEVAQKYIKWALDDVKFIESISKDEKNK